ncbi:MAG: hypothetical protein M3O70_16580 [Actinomycetota bacterium]|nr:hypothetical protein [Actinomycetota bacterium]
MSASESKEPNVGEADAGGEVGPIEIENWKMVKIALSEDQQAAIKAATGENLLHLRIVVEDLVDLADLVAN